MGKLESYRRYHLSEKGQAAKARAMAKRKTPEERAKRRAYKARPEVKARAEELRKIRHSKADMKAKLRERRRRNLLASFGITEEEFRKLSAAQGGVCAICHDPPSHSTHGGPPVLCIDHCHKTGRVRGLLCTHCNAALGGSRDRADILRKMIEYLESPPAITVVPTAKRVN